MDRGGSEEMVLDSCSLLHKGEGRERLRVGGKGRWMQIYCGGGEGGMETHQLWGRCFLKSLLWRLLPLVLAAEAVSSSG